MRPTNAVFILAAAFMAGAYALRLPRDLSPASLSPDDRLILATDLASMTAALDAGADPQGGPHVAHPPLFHAINRHFDAGVELLLARGANPDGAATLHPLIFAAATGQPHATTILLQHGANPNARNSHGQTALHLLAARPDLDPQLITILLAAGANPNLPDFQGHTPLALACLNHHPQAQRLLLAAGANPLQKNRAGLSPADLAPDAPAPGQRPLLFSDLR